jgi:hypothetical protein
MDLWNSYRDYRLAVVAEIVKSTGWSENDAADVAGDVDEAMAEGNVAAGRSERDYSPLTQMINEASQASQVSNSRPDAAPAVGNGEPPPPVYE